MKQLCWLTDIHLDHLDDDEIVAFAHSLRVNELVITGDISNSSRLVRDVELFVNSLDTTCAVSFVLGNHCYYGGFIDKTRAYADEICLNNSNVSYLTNCGVKELTDNVCLIGTDGWCDTALGTIYGSVIMNDWYYIKDLQVAQRTGGITEIARKCDELAGSEVDNLKKRAAVAVAKYNHVIIATHVPPWKESAWHENSMSNDEFLPWFCSYVMGVFLEQLAVDNPDTKFTVLCGHVHTASVHQVCSNMVCYTGQADYGKPSIAGHIVIDDCGVKMIDHDNPYRNGV